MNALRSGVDLVGLMLDLAFARPVAVQPIGKAGVRTHQLLIAVLGAAAAGSARRGVAREIWQALAGRGDYACSNEELTPVRGDPIAALPVVAAAVLTLVSPSAGKLFERGAVGGYALSPEGWEQILAMASADPAKPSAPRT